MKKPSLKGMPDSGNVLITFVSDKEKYYRLHTYHVIGQLENLIETYQEAENQGVITSISISDDIGQEIDYIPKYHHVLKPEEINQNMSLDYIDSNTGYRVSFNFYAKDKDRYIKDFKKKELQGTISDLKVYDYKGKQVEV